MRVIQLTPGTGSFYCGTCMRDNALVAELRRHGHDALTVPLYLPLALDETPTTEDAPLFYGGVNVYLQQKSSLFRRTPRWLDRLLDAAPVLRLAAGRAGSTDAKDLGDLTLSMLRGEEGHQAKELDRLVEWVGDVRPDVVCLSNALLIGLARRIQRTGAAVVCTLQGEDTFLDSLPERDRSTAWRVLVERGADVDAFIAVSHYYGEVMRRRMDLPADRLHVVPNGISLEGYAPARTRPDPPVLGYLARLCPTKGLGTLVEAYLLLRRDGRAADLQLRVAGTMTATDEPYVRHLQARIAAAGLEQEVQFQPNLDRNSKIRFLQGLTVFSVPATYGESFGLYVIEAMAAGIPVVQPRHAAFPEILEATGGGMLCEPDDPESLAAAIDLLLREPETARAMGECGRQAVQQQFSVSRMTEGVIQVLEQVSSARCPVPGARCPAGRDGEPVPGSFPPGTGHRAPGTGRWALGSEPGQAANQRAAGFAGQLRLRAQSPAPSAQSRERSDQMAYEFRMVHRVEFVDTDMAGIIHFASYFRYMEVTEHAFFRSLGFSIHTCTPDLQVGWPRVNVSCDFREPLRFEEEIEVCLRVREKRTRSLTYDFSFRKVNDPTGTEVAQGSMTVVCVSVDPETRRMRAVPIPDAIACQIEEAPKEPKEETECDE